MKSRWETLSERINALSLRERVFLSFSVIACCLALADVVWLSPAQLLQKQAVQRLDKQTADLLRARAELTTIVKPAQGASAARDEAVALQGRLELVNQKIKDLLPSNEETTPLTQALFHFLRRHEGLTLVRISAVTPEFKAAPAAGAGNSAAPAGLARQGVELTVSGPYSELVRYVQTLEKALPNVRWGPMTLKSEKLPPELKLQLFLLGVQP